ncbi:type II secretion system F family protein [Neorhodopirellula pilleata]|uniref:Bacterial type II secretion system protein F domain protein n=1 Tax=Neorhodopirellula pilleata TaxID=2714738 RepID=A0A5C6AZX8_9BACT|nr:type II secretion system F family protein [Neorhodopirellula pilleata]TWU03704.1 Bacterial type II secretion system protein F domain protein [Neorhodopirellula pilleata]
MIAISSALYAASIGLLTWALFEIVTRERVSLRDVGRFEIERRELLRQRNPTYRRFEPLIDEWNRSRKIKPKTIEETDFQLAAAGVREPWTATEYLNLKFCESCFIAACSFLVGRFILGSSFFGSVCLGVLVFYVMQWSVAQTLRKNAAKRQLIMKRRFAAAIDLMALMMGVGAGFGECLDVAVIENRNNPLGEELALVKKEIQMGAVRGKALMGIANRVRDPDITEVIKSINEGEELGTPLSGILQNQAEQMRMKRSHWAEKAAEESQVAIVFPAMLIMLACLLIVVAPFVLTAFADGESF